jgi:hypothetical protein
MSAIVRADQATGDQDAIVVRAWGKAGGSIEHGAGAAHPAFVHDIQAGTIARTALQAEMQHGIGLFLRNIRTQAVLSHGQFVGWRLLALFPQRPDVHVQGLQAGDVLLRVNGASIERPEAFKRVWDELERTNEIVFEIERDGELSAVRYTITG